MWHIAVYNEHQHDQFCSVGERFALVKADGDITWRLVDGHPRASDAAAIRFYITGGSLVVDCRGIEAGVEIACGGSFSCGVPIHLSLPSIFQIGETWIEVRGEASVESLGLEPLNGKRTATGARVHNIGATNRGPDAETVGKWLAAAGQLHRIAASSPTFFDVAAQIALDSTGLDAALVVTRTDGQWCIAGSAVTAPEHGISFEAAAVELLRQQPDVWRRSPRVLADDEQSAHDNTADESIVVAPVRNETGETIAAMYGVRHSRGDNRRRGIRTLEARVVELLADAVGVGMARRQQEIESARQRVLLEQAFSPAVADHLQRHPEALAGQTREVTLLFADLRGFTALAETLSPADACDLLAAVMEMLTQAIMSTGGAVIDYYGDGVSAMWNAPLDTPDHADRACAAAMQMLEGLPAVSRQWQRVLSQPLQLGIGLHTDTVQVGNAGTRQRLKYGPRGTAVNIASRVQSAAKRLDVALLATNSVRRRLSSRFVTLRVCTARLPGLEQPLELFTVFPSTDALRLQDDLARYADALDAFERGDLTAAEEQLVDLLAAGPATPAAFLAQQTAALRQGGLGRRVSDEFGCTPDAVVEILAK
jgi:class 3 adenylate cyclase